MKRAFAAAVAMVMTLGLSCGGSSAAESSGVIAVASEFPLSEPGTADAKGAVEAAIAEHPTLRGYRLIPISLDDSLGGGFDLDKSLQNAKRATRDPQILGVVGPWSSNIARSVVSIAGQDNLVMLSPSSTADCLTARPNACFAVPTSNNFYRIAAPDSVAARAAADFAVRSLGLAQFAVLHDDKKYGRALTSAFTKELAEVGGKVVFSGGYTSTDVTFAPLLRDAQHAGAQALYVGGLSTFSACRLRAAMNGIFSPDTYFISGDAILDPACVTDAGTLANEHLVATVSAREPDTVPASLKGLTRGRLYDAYNFAAYDCARILIAAIDRAIQSNGGKIPTREEVRSAVAATANFKGLTGTYSFNANGDATTPAVSFYYVRGNSWTFWQNAP